MDLITDLPAAASAPLDEEAPVSDEDYARIMRRIAEPGATVSAFNSSI